MIILFNFKLLINNIAGKDYVCLTIEDLGRNKIVEVCAIPLSFVFISFISPEYAFTFT